MGSIPDSARGPTRDLAGGLAVEEVGDRLFLVTDGDYQAMVADTGEGIVAFDAPWAAEYLAAIRRVSTAPVTHVVYSHSHYEHIGGAGHLGATEVVAQQSTADILSRHADHRRPVPTMTFDREMTLDAGLHRIELRYHGPNHQDGNIFIPPGAAAGLDAGRRCSPRLGSFPCPGRRYGRRRLPGRSRHRAEYPLDTLVAGHLARTGTASDVRILREHLDDLRHACIQARQSVNPGDIAAATGSADKWRFARTYFDQLAVSAASQVQPRWADRLSSRGYSAVLVSSSPEELPT